MPSTDRDLLLTLYRSAGAEANLPNWDTDADISDWEGVGVNDEGRVVELQLPFRNLRGPIPDALGALTELQVLKLNDNKLSGEIPASLGQLGNLQTVYLHHNQLSGEIPASLGLLVKLGTLSLFNNQLSGRIPASLGQLGNIRRGGLRNHQLSGEIPASLGQLDHLATLFLSNNKLSGKIPGSLGQLGRMRMLDLSNNYLSGEMPASLSQLGEMEMLDLSSNQLSGKIPASVGQLDNLGTLFLSNNRLSGEIPTSVGLLGNLMKLHLFKNQLSGEIPASLGQLGNMEMLDLYNNKLSGKIPASFGQLGKVEKLDLSNNQLSGDIPASLGHLREVQTLDLSNNQLSGVVPASLGQLGKVEKLDLSNNQLSGVVPASLGQLGNLMKLRLSNNQLSGLWPTLRHDQAGSMTARPGGLDGALDDDDSRHVGILPVALASLLDRFEGIPALHLDPNQWEHPPESIVMGGLPSVREYFEAVFRDGTSTVVRPLKVVIIGKETVGKTSLRHSIKTGKPYTTRKGGEDSTVHVDVEDHEVDGHPIRMFDCAGQVVYYGLLQLFLTPRAVYLLVWDAERASEMDTLNLEDLAIAPWLRYLTFRVPDANVVLVGNKWDRVTKAKREVAVDVRHQSREWLDSWIQKAHGHQPLGLSLEDDVCLVSCARAGRGVWASSSSRAKGWPCDKSEPGLFHRIMHNQVGDTRAVTMCLPRSYEIALEVLEDLGSCSRSDAQQQTPGITRASLKQKWEARVHELDKAGTPVAAPESAMSGAILIRKWEGGLVEYGNYIFFDVEWFATVLDPLFSHKRVSLGDMDLGGKTVTNVRSLTRLNEKHVFEPQLAEDLWGPELAQDLLSALISAGLAFPFPRDPNGGLVILLRMGTERPPDYGMKLEEADQAGKHDLKLKVECSFSLGLPPGFVERLLARCCHLGFPHPFWRFGALIVGDGEEDGLFSLSLEYSEEERILTVEVYGGCKEVHAWAALSKVLSVMIKMLLEFPGLLCEPTFFCPRHGERMAINRRCAQPGSRLVEESDFCSRCLNRGAGKDLLAAALQVVEFSDTEFFDEHLRLQFAETVAGQGGAPWPGSNSEIFFGGAPTEISPRSQISTGQAPVQICPRSQTPWYQDVKMWVGAASAAFLAISGVFASKEDDDPHLWGVFLGVGALLILVEFVLIAREYKLLCFIPRVKAAGAENEPRGEAYV